MAAMRRSDAPCRAALAVADWLDRPAVWLGSAGAWLLLPMIAVIAFDVVGRRYIRKLDFVVEHDLHFLINSPKLQDSEWHFSAALILLALGYAFSRNVQIRLDIVRHRFSPRTRVSIELCGTLVLLPFLGTMIYFAFEFASRAWSSGEGSQVLIGLGHRWAIKSFVVIGLATLAMAALSLVLRMLVWLFGPPELAALARLESIAGTVAAGEPAGRRPPTN
jgi:TRAP-type mannitol/chloroaromatic compound transport system permease small subunit